MAVLHYGTDSSVRLEFADGVAPELCGTPRGVPLTDPAAAVAAALDRPLDYPPLAKTAMPGDRVALVLDHAAPQAARVAAAVIRTLVSAGVEPDGISILRTEADIHSGGEDPCRLLDATLAERISTVTHDPEDRADLAYLAADDNGQPILLNRLLTDADVVLPIGCLQNEAATGYFGIHTPVFPTFSDQRTLLRFRRLDALGGDGPCKRRLRSEVDQTAWLLGVNFTVQWVPAAGDRLLHVVAGQSDAVRRRGRQLYDDAWNWLVPRRASLVVAAIEGGDDGTDLGEPRPHARNGRRAGRGRRRHCRLLRLGRCSRSRRAEHGGRPLPAVGAETHPQGPAGRRPARRATGPRLGSRQGLSAQPAGPGDGRGVGDDSHCGRR